MRIRIRTRLPKTKRLRARKSKKTSLRGSVVQIPVFEVIVTVQFRAASDIGMLMESSNCRQI